jgi:predicted nucleic acid-binding Zn ribbon protein
MPTYEYLCPNEHSTCIFSTNPNLVTDTQTCPECGEVARKQIGPGSGAIFRGPGFHVNDYPKEKRCTRDES